jgi:hypothetical protein
MEDETVEKSESTVVSSHGDEENPGLIGGL